MPAKRCAVRWPSKGSRRVDARAPQYVYPPVTRHAWRAGTSQGTACRAPGWAAVQCDGRPSRSLCISPGQALSLSRAGSRRGVTAVGSEHNAPLRKAAPVATLALRLVVCLRVTRRYVLRPAPSAAWPLRRHAHKHSRVPACRRHICFSQALRAQAWRTTHPASGLQRALVPRLQPRFAVSQCASR